MKMKVVLFYQKFIIFLLCLGIGVCFLSANYGFETHHSVSNLVAANNTFPRLRDIFKNFFDSPFKNHDDNNLPDEYVYVGGFPIGLALATDGVVVIAKGTVTTVHGEINTTNGSDIKVGDIITHLDDYKVSSTEDIELYLGRKYDGKTNVSVKLMRGDDQVSTTILPEKDCLSDKFKLGLWVRDSASGVGTMTFIKENGEFSALGHPISDVDTASKFEVKNGNIFKCNIVGVQKGTFGTPGELRGLFLKNGASIGELFQNTEFGAKGVMNKSFMEKANLHKMKVGRKGFVKTGKATILTTIDGVTPEEFDIEIVKTSVQNEPQKKIMILHVTDKRLLEKTGGIVQGMSGSPIIQNGRIVGAVTHVFVNDPTRGYGLFMDWML
ncbi:MAG: SpoIVB peptidase [Clostridia bacterium]|nr:SpoIVB peptidase [Clostridia bacterium]